MPFVTGETLLEEAATRQPGVPTIVVTGKDTIESAVQCTKRGASDYLVKPVPAERIVTTVRKALEMGELMTENRQLSEGFLSPDVRHPDNFSDIVTCDAMMKAIFIYIEAIAPTNNCVLLTGETGVGKELVAKAIHKSSGRSGQFVAVNIAGLDDTMFSDTLFGHTRGAFTGADAARQGLIAQAQHGTLFLDEIGDLTVASQVKLLRLLQEQEYTPLGQDRPVKTDARVLVATNADLAKLQDAGKFRPDLYYRLSTHKVHIPPLRKRIGDIEPLVEHFLESAARRLNKNEPTAPKELYTILAAYKFPGNVRELEAMVNDAVARHSSRMLSLTSFREHIVAMSGEAPSVQTAGSPPPSQESEGLFGAKLPPYKDIKRLLVEEAMRRANGNRTLAAQLLGTSRQVISASLDK
jgi:DNA-binding NtrC family response regulator